MEHKPNQPDIQNRKYIGENLWNRTKQFTDPETEKIDVRVKPESVLVRVACPSWRIISDEQWEAVQARLDVINLKLSPRRLAGINRTAKKDYLFSGLLDCGVCHGPMVITGGKDTEASYGCRAARYGRGCNNKLRIRADRFSAAMIEALQQQVLTDETSSI